jgi:hypothetical protein
MRIFIELMQIIAENDSWNLYNAKGFDNRQKITFLSTLDSFSWPCNDQELLFRVN